MTYFKETIPSMIDKHKKMITECLKVMGDKIQADLADDKMHNVIKSKRMAAETVEWSAKEIDRLENELNSNELDDKKEPVNFSEKLAE